MKHTLILFLLTGSVLATTPEALPVNEDSEQHHTTIPPVVIKFETAIRNIRDERSAAEATAQVQELVPHMKELLRGQTWQNEQERQQLAQILNAAFNLLLTEPPCYGSRELAAAIEDLLQLFTKK